MKRLVLTFAVLLVFARCALRSEVGITQLRLVPGDISRGSDLDDMWQIGDYARAAEQATAINAKPNKTPEELATLGKAELVCYRLDSARTHLREALELKPSHTLAADIAWSLSQVEYLANNYGAAEEWARAAVRGGIAVKDWHIKYLASLSGIETHRISQTDAGTTHMEFGKPEIPRISVVINGGEASAVIDSGAVISIISEDLAERVGVRSLGTFKGDFFGLLGEPISVRFGLLESINIGGIEITNVPVAIMSNKNLHFFISNKKNFRMDLLLGSNILRNFRVELDFRRKEVKWIPLQSKDRRPTPDQNLFLFEFRPFVHATINRRGWYLFVLDTGSEVTFLNEGAVSQTKVRYSPRFHGATLQGLGGAKKRGEKIEDVQIGVDRWAGDFKDLPLYSSESSRAVGIVGQNLLKNFRVVLDFGTMKMELHRDRILGSIQ